MLHLDDLLSQDLYFSRHLDVLYSLRPRNLSYNFNLNRLLNPHLHNLRNCNRVGDRSLLLNNMRHFHNVLDDLLSHHRLLDDNLYRHLVLERHDHLAILHCHFMNLDDFLNYSVTVNFYRHFPDHLSRDSPLDLNFLGYFFLDDDFN